MRSRILNQVKNRKGFKQLPSKNGLLQNVFARQNLILGILLMMIAAIACGCVAPNHKVGESIDVGQAMESAIKNEITQTAMAKPSMREQLDRSYSNEFLALDLSATEARLTKELEVRQEKHLSEIIGGPVIVDYELEFYRDSLKEAQEKNLGIEAMLLKGAEGSKDFGKYKIKKSSATVYGFADGNMGKKAIDEFDLRLNTYWASELKTSYFIYPRSVLNRFSLEQIQGMDYPFRELNKVSRYITCQPMQHFQTKEGILKTKKMLKEKYKEDFECINSSNLDYWCPVKEPDLWFEISVGGTDMYLPTLAQKRMGEQINKIIEEEGAADRIVQYTQIEDTGSIHEVYDATWDTGNLTNLEQFYREGYKGSFRTALIYLQAPDQPVDYDLLCKVSYKIKKILGEKESDKHVKHLLSVYIYSIPDAPRGIAVKLFGKDLTPNNHFRTRTLADTFEEMTIIKTDMEGFEVLDTYGERQNWYSPGVFYMTPEMTGEEFKGRYFEPLVKQ